MSADVTKAQHTPGPWCVEELDDAARRSYVRDNQSIHDVAFWIVSEALDEVVTLVDHHEQHRARVTADAYLIAAAPELLDACKEALALDAIDAFAGNEDTRRMLREAIAKAEGRQS